MREKGKDRKKIRETRQKGRQSDKCMWLNKRFVMATWTMTTQLQI